MYRDCKCVKKEVSLKVETKEMQKQAFVLSFNQWQFMMVTTPKMHIAYFIYSHSIKLMLNHECHSRYSLV